MKTNCNLIQRCLPCVMLLVFSARANAQISFAPATTYNFGKISLGVAAADVSGDGKVELIAAIYGSNSATVLTNSGSGIFGSNATYRVSGPESVVAADVNGDGKVDLIFADATDNGLNVWTNDGTGSFVQAAFYRIGGNDGTVTWVIAADVNGDGKVDLLTGNNASLVVLTNAGNGNFALASTPGAGSMSVVAADVNGDGKIDLIEVNGSTSLNTLMVLTNNGSGAFTLCSTNVLSTHWAGLLTTADVNGDGKVDVIVPDYGSGSGKTLEVLTNDGPGNFGSNSTCMAGIGPYCVIAADLDGDGKDELICGSRGPVSPATWTILTNNGTGVFGSNSMLNAGSFFGLAADVNGDGKLDLVTVGTNLTVLLNTSIFPVPVSTPPLAINSTRNTIHVSWPSASAGWSLQQSPDLIPAHWYPSGYSGYGISDDGTNKSLTVAPLTGNLCFRLLHP